MYFGFKNVSLKEKNNTTLIKRLRATRFLVFSELGLFFSEFWEVKTPHFQIQFSQDNIPSKNSSYAEQCFGVFLHTFPNLLKTTVQYPHENETLLWSGGSLCFQCWWTAAPPEPTRAESQWAHSGFTGRRAGLSASSLSSPPPPPSAMTVALYGLLLMPRSYRFFPQKMWTCHRHGYTPIRIPHTMTER